MGHGGRVMGFVGKSKEIGDDGADGARHVGCAALIRPTVVIALFGGTK